MSLLELEESHWRRFPLCLNTTLNYFVRRLSFVVWMRSTTTSACLLVDDQNKERLCLVMNMNVARSPHLPYLTWRIQPFPNHFKSYNFVMSMPLRLSEHKSSRDSPPIHIRCERLLQTHKVYLATRSLTYTSDSSLAISVDRPLVTLKLCHRRINSSAELDADERR